MTNKEIIPKLYAALAVGDVPTVLGATATQSRSRRLPITYIVTRTITEE
jgi:hypothetical protein